MEGFITYLPNYLISIFIINIFFIGCIFCRYILKCLHECKIISLKEYFYVYDDYFAEFMCGVDGCFCLVITMFYILGSCMFIN